MAQLVKMPLDDGGELLIESADGQGAIPVGAGGRVVQASETVQKAMGNIRSAAEAVLGELRAMEQPPSKVNVEFGIKVTGEASLAIAKSSGEANFNVTIEWNDVKPS
jgi:NTP-dependent ternary system trypsin peptidase co-occuring protein